MIVYEAISFIFDVCGLRIHVSGNRIFSQLFFKESYLSCLLIGILRTAIIYESETAPLTNDDGYLLSVEKRIAHYQRIGGYPIELAVNQLFQQLFPFSDLRSVKMRS